VLYALGHILHLNQDLSLSGSDRRFDWWWGTEQRDVLIDGPSRMVPKCLLSGLFCAEEAPLQREREAIIPFSPLTRSRGSLSVSTP
jgi:hypothetical protein